MVQSPVATHLKPVTSSVSLTWHLKHGCKEVLPQMMHGIPLMTITGLSDLQLLPLPQPLQLLLMELPAHLPPQMRELLETKMLNAIYIMDQPTRFTLVQQTASQLRLKDQVSELVLKLVLLHWQSMKVTTNGFMVVMLLVLTLLLLLSLV